jgi:hypothetical protein
MWYSGGPQSQFYLIDIGSCLTNNDGTCDGMLPVSKKIRILSQVAPSISSILGCRMQKFKRTQFRACIVQLLRLISGGSQWMGGSPTLCFPILVSKLVTFPLHFCTRLWVYRSSQHMNTAPNHTIGRGAVPQLSSDLTCFNEW